MFTIKDPRQLSIYMSGDMYEGLERAAATDQRSLSGIIRIALTEYLERQKSASTAGR